MAKEKEVKKGTVAVTVQQSDRMEAINNLSAAIRNVSEALASNVDVSIRDCTFQGPEIGINITTDPKVTGTDTLIYKDVI